MKSCKKFDLFIFFWVEKNRKYFVSRPLIIFKVEPEFLKYESRTRSPDAYKL